MVKKECFTYLVKGSEDIGDFSKAIMLLTTLKAEKEIVEFRTFYGNENIRIISNIDNDFYFEDKIGEIMSKEPCTVFLIEREDVHHSVVEEIDRSIDNKETLHISLDVD
jgi:hypothetical protein